MHGLPPCIDGLHADGPGFWSPERVGTGKIVGAMHDPVPALHECRERLLVGIEQLGIDTCSLERMHDIIDVVEVGPFEIRPDALTDELVDRLPAMLRQLAHAEMILRPTSNSELE